MSEMGLLSILLDVVCGAYLISAASDFMPQLHSQFLGGLS
jgi:hypothetical protein